MQTPIRDAKRRCDSNQHQRIVAIAGDIMTMPGLPRLPAANGIHLDTDGHIEGLF